MALVTHFYLIHNKSDNTNELLGLFRTYEEASDVRRHWNIESKIPINEMTILEKTEDIVLHPDNPIDN